MSGLLQNKLEEVRLTNIVGLIKGDYRISSDLKQAISYYQESQAKRYYDIKYALGTRYGMELMNFLAPTKLGRHMYYKFSINWDFVVSNIPGPSEPLLFNDRKVEDVYWWIPNGTGLSISIFAMTYWNKFRLYLTLDNSVDIEGKRLIKYFEHELENAFWPD